MKASIIIPTYNEEAMIAATLRSARKQRADAPYEILVVDGGSSDDTHKIVGNFGVPFLLAPRRGKAEQGNYAAQRARGEILCFVDADTFLPDNYIARITRFFDGHPNVLACGARFKYVDHHVKQWRLGSHTFTITTYEPISWIMAAWYIVRDLMNFTELPGCNMCVRRNAFFAVGGLHPVPQGLGIDAAFSFELRRLARMQPHMRLRFLLGPPVLTAARHLSLARSSKRQNQIQRYFAAQSTANDSGRRVPGTSS